MRVSRFYVSVPEQLGVESCLLGWRPRSPAEATVAAAMKINTRAKRVPSWFPEGSGEYRAKANIWTDWAGFKAANDKLVAASADLVAATKTMDSAQIGAALGATGKTCGGCHETYRGPKPS